MGIGETPQNRSARGNGIKTWGGLIQNYSRRSKKSKETKGKRTHKKDNEEAGVVPF